jgi:hypothetical protein
VDIILDDDEEDQKMGEGEAEQEGREALNPEEDYVPEPVQAKTDVVRCKCLFFLRAQLGQDLGVS